MWITRIMAKVILFPVWMLLVLAKWITLLMVSCSAVIFRLLAFIFFLTAIAGYAFGLESAETTWRSLAIALGTFLIPMTASVVLAGIEIADMCLRNVIFGLC
ncbi:MAG: hypothetical protein Q4B57_10480 [Eubacteriales bacterium]|nr:hypothetical protein [Eubacteriales bacterium]